MKLSPDQNTLNLDDGSEHVAVTTPPGYSCQYCSLTRLTLTCANTFGACRPDGRKDGRSVVFALRKGPDPDPAITGET